MNAPNAFPWEGGSAENIGDLGGSVYAALVVELG